ncbi:PDZ domain-containing protein [Sphingomonas sp. BK235]|uniref:PDZ domain-containing protein n=1 Tax=Sphingomonas sp. BK235 TaxID=2512131 RepID=UPI0010D7858A|nr:PDZ domain-containing protein [Sphingomonas sp. BK235]TCP36852.1 PDZ domain-containing protein [Sphingomonas sp. BK235]
MTALQPLDRLVLVAGVAAAIAAAAAMQAVRALHAPRSADVGATFVVTEPPRGVAPMVTSLRAGGPAERAGLAVGDLIERIDGRAPATLAEVQHGMATRRLVRLLVRRAGHDVAIVVREPGGNENGAEDPADRGR